MIAIVNYRMFDLQINGLTIPEEQIHCDFWDFPDQETIKSLSQYLFKQDTKAYLPTLITSSVDTCKTNLKIINKAIQQQNIEAEAQIKGVHIEGGFISKLGIHPQEHAESLDLQFAKEICKLHPGLIKLWTLCPQKDLELNNGDLTRFLQDQDITVSFGHSSCSYDLANKAFDELDVKLVTHWGNAMRIIDGLQNRAVTDADLEALDNFDTQKQAEQAGLGLAAYRRDDIYCMAIAGSKAAGDLHLDPRLLKKLADKKGDKLILTSDAVAYSTTELKTKAISGLRGGRETLKQHCHNAINAGLTEEQVNTALNKSAYTLFGPY